MRNLNLNPTVAIFASMEMARTKVQIYLMFLRSISNTGNSLLHFQVKTKQRAAEYLIGCRFVTRLSGQTSIFDFVSKRLLGIKGQKEP